MGTRGLTCVVKDGEFKVAQYGQWDHYPSGQGATILDFLKNKLNRAMFEEQLNKCRFGGEEEIHQLYVDEGITDGWMNMEQAANFKAKHPQIDRDMGGEVLEFIQETTLDDILLNDQSEFANDGLFCEWAYVVDLDNDKFEVYNGFHTGDPPEGNRFNGRSDNGEYSAVHLQKVYDLDNLPDTEQFCKDLGEDDDEE